MTKKIVIVKKPKRKTTKGISTAEETIKKKEKTYRDKKVSTNKERFLRALEEKQGIVTRACKKAKMSAWSFYDYYNKDEEFANEVDRIQGVFEFVCESLVQEDILDGDSASRRFYLSKRSKRYKSRTELGVDEDTVKAFSFEIVKGKKDDN